MKLKSLEKIINELFYWYRRNDSKIHNDKDNNGPSSFNKIRLLGQMTPLRIYGTTLKRHDPATRFVFQSFSKISLCGLFI